MTVAADRIRRLLRDATDEYVAALEPQRRAYRNGVCVGLRLALREVEHDGTADEHCDYCGDPLAQCHCPAAAARAGGTPA